MESLWHRQTDRYDQSSALSLNQTCLPFASPTKPYSCRHRPLAHPTTRIGRDTPPAPHGFFRAITNWATSR